MSGIAGIYYRNFKPISFEKLQTMGIALAHRGLDGVHYYCRGPVGFVHCKIHDTIESLSEELPKKSEDGRFVITFQGRIDNRKELFDQTGWRKPLSKVTDGDIVLAAYMKWGKECANYLLGDFAFVVFDQVERKLFCARDQMGVKPFYYYCTEKIFAFSSEIKGIFAIPEIPRVINEERVADYFTNIVLENTTTFFSDINRLPPGHVMLISERTKEIIRYHTFTPHYLSCKSDNEYEEAFREIFTDAVRVRLRTSSTIGAFLSGGLDSGAIVSVASEILKGIPPNHFQTFSGVFNILKKCDERKFFDLIKKRFSLSSYTLPIDSIDPSIAYEKLSESEDEPFWAPHVFMSMGLLDLMKSNGVRVLLDGHDGDAAVSYGYNRITETALSGDVVALFRSYRRGGVASSVSIIRRILALYWKIFCSSAPVYFPGSSLRDEISQALKTLNPEFLRRIKIKDRLSVRLSELPRVGMKEQEYHWKKINQPSHPFALEFLERVTVNYGIIARYPFFDKRVIEFCLALPASQKFRMGYNRAIVRRSFSNILPEAVRNRKEKTDFSLSLLHAFSVNDGGWLLRNIDEISESDYKYANKDFYLSKIRNFLDITRSDRFESLVDCLCLVSFSRWKREYFQ